MKRGQRPPQVQRFGILSALEIALWSFGLWDLGFSKVFEGLIVFMVDCEDRLGESWVLRSRVTRRRAGALLLCTYMSTYGLDSSYS